MARSQWVDMSFGKLKVYLTSEGHYHAVTFGIERDNLDDLIQAVETAYHTPEGNSGNGEYEAQYAYACGYYD